VTTGRRGLVPKSFGVARSLGEVLKAHRLRTRLSQSAVARRAGLDASVLSNIESGNRESLRFETVAKLAEVLGVSLDAIAAECGFRFKATTRSSIGTDIAQLAELLRIADTRFQSGAERISEALRLIEALGPQSRSPSGRKKR
jgi:transcriptional regulator with XRE-family HTH domain